MTLTCCSCTSGSPSCIAGGIGQASCRHNRQRKFPGWGEETTTTHQQHCGKRTQVLRLLVNGCIQMSGKHRGAHQPHGAAGAARTSVPALTSALWLQYLARGRGFDPLYRPRAV
jgi:hypothetical protein